MAAGLNFVVGVLQVALALVVARHLGRFGRAFPWLGALMIFFALRGIDRIYVAVVGRDAVVDLVTDLAILLVLVLLTFGLDRTVRGLAASEDLARYRQAEYDRALADYRTLARHRLANPVAAIRGSATTLTEVRDLDEQTRGALVETIRREAERLERIALDPEPIGREEQPLRPRPDV